MKHKIYIGDYPTIDNYIDGTKIKPQDTAFGESDGVIVFTKIPKNIDQYLKYSVYPIYILLQDTKNIPYKLYSKFDIIHNGGAWTMKKFAENIFFNPDRKFVYKQLTSMRPNVFGLWSWISKNAISVYDEMPAVLLKIDEQVLMTLSDRYFYMLVSFNLSCSNNVRKLRW